MVKLCPRRAFWEASRLVDQLWLIRSKRINLHLQGNSYSIHHIPEGVLTGSSYQKCCLVTGVSNASTAAKAQQRTEKTASCRSRLPPFNCIPRFAQ